MKNIYLLLVLFLSFIASPITAQKKVSEISLVYDVVVTNDSPQPKLADAFDGASASVYIKGPMSRSEMVSALASFTTIHDARNSTSVLLQEVSGQKLLIRMSPENWKEKNKRYEGITFTDTKETKVIAGYKCKKAIASMKDGTTFTVYYTDEIIPDNPEYNYQFRNLKGLPLEYERSMKNLKMKYTVSKIDINPVPVSKFDIPQSGYREMTYEESRKLGIGN
ncbi:MAG: hypothetical protein H7Y03_09280 [Chitinophagaceae bacterium]|nr:hypothetical protein [Chitinophagaceae bacterium]